MNKILIVFLLLNTFSLQAVELFKADYKVFKDGKEIGANSIELSRQDDFYKITDRTDGTYGMASFLGFKRIEETLFNEIQGGYIPDFYHMLQKVAFNKRVSEYQVDNETDMVYGKYKGNEWQLKTPETSFSTPNLVSLNLFRDICKGKTENLDYPVLKRGELTTYRFKITSEQDGIVEVDKIHSKPTRVTKTWLDRNQQCLPVKTYHKEDDEDAVETKLIKVVFNS